MISDKDFGSKSAERKYYATNIFPNFHSGHENFFVYITRYHSPTIQNLKRLRRVSGLHFNNWFMFSGK